MPPDQSEKIRNACVEAVSASEEKFAKAFHAAPAFFSISTLKDARYLDVNEEFLRGLKYRREEVIGHTALELGIWDNLDDRQQMIQQLKENRRVRNFETRLRNKDGEVITGLISTEMIEINGEKCLLTITRDITDYRKADQERQRLLDQLEAVLENINEGVVISDLEGNIITMNSEALVLHGYQSVDQIHNRLTDFRQDFELFDLQEQILPLEKWPLTKATNGERFSDYQIRIHDKKSGRRWIASYNGTPVNDKSGKTILAVITIRDITAAKQLEEEIRILNAKLAGRAAELETANKELEAFTYTVSHDLRKPLALINGYCQMLKEFCGTMDAQCREFIEKTYEGTIKMSRLIDALMKFSQASHLYVQMQTVDLSAIATTILGELGLSEPERSVDQIVQPNVITFGDAGLLHVVLENLLGNAWKYTSKRSNAVIHFGERDTDGCPTYFVRDNGAGFDMADAVLLFEPFQRLPGADQYEGHGIGLATAAKIIRRHGGKIWAESNPGEGATFFFTLTGCQEKHVRQPEDRHES